MVRYFVTTFLIFGIGVSLLSFSLTNLDPFGAQRGIAYFTFFVALFASVTSLCTFIAFFSSELYRKKRQGERAFLRALRRGMFIGTFVCVIAILQIFRLLGLVEAFLFALFLALLEWAFVGAGK